MIVCLFARLFVCSLFCLLFVAGCVLFVVRCFLFVVVVLVLVVVVVVVDVCLLFVVCCLLIVVCCVLIVVAALLFFSGTRRSHSCLRQRAGLGQTLLFTLELLSQAMPLHCRTSRPKATP